MVPSRDLAARFEAYSDWRRRLSAGVLKLHEWLQEQDLADTQVDVRVQQLLERLHQDKLIVAFVAEFSRGKSELINAIFFADFGQRLLPSAAGRTTMCPTELLYDAQRPPSIRLLPIETRLKDATVAEFKNYADEWVTFALDLSSAEKMGEALSRVSQVKRVPVELARKYGLYGDGEDDIVAALEHGDEGSVDIPCWRHAVINFPHPLLQQGLVILDTPGLNAIGTEPELTLNLLPNAHALLFILAADAGVTKTDLEVWNQHLAGDDPATKAGRIVILNKIDGLWDELKTEDEINREIERQVKSTAHMLAIPQSQVYAADLSEDAVALARENARHLQLHSRTEFGAGDLLAPFDKPELHGTIDLLTCNPPYISSAKVDHMHQEIAAHEPHLAFDGGPFGVNILMRLLQDAPRFLNHNGWLAFEVGLGSFAEDREKQILHGREVVVHQRRLDTRLGGHPTGRRGRVTLLGHDPGSSVQKSVPRRRVLRASPCL